MGNVKAFTLLGFGYLLVFAAMYKSGKYATHPWAALAEGSPAEPPDPPLGFGGPTTGEGGQGGGGGGGGFG